MNQLWDPTGSRQAFWRRWDLSWALEGKEEFDRPGRRYCKEGKRYGKSVASKAGGRSDNNRASLGSVMF